MGHLKAWVSAVPHLLSSQPNSHCHPLVSSDENPEYKCKSCHQKGFGTMLKCETCTEDYRIHPDCAKPPTIKIHPLLKRCIFHFCSSGGEEYRCLACDKKTSGSFYQCSSCNKVIHLYCANLKKEIIINGDRLMLKDMMLDRCYNCQLSRKERRGLKNTWVYESKNRDCRLHVYCARKLVAKRMRNSTSQQIQRFFRQRVSGLNVELWITMAVAIVSALMGNPTGVLDVFMSIFAKTN